MDVQRYPSQSSETLREFYSDAINPRVEEIGQRMLALLDGLAAAEGPALWGLTSHLALGLFLASGDSKRRVTVHSHGPGYVVESTSEGDNVSRQDAAIDVPSAVAIILTRLGISGTPRQ